MNQHIKPLISLQVPIMIWMWTLSRNSQTKTVSTQCSFPPHYPQSVPSLSHWSLDIPTTGQSFIARPDGGRGRVLLGKLLCAGLSPRLTSASDRRQWGNAASAAAEKVQRGRNSELNHREFTLWAMLEVDPALHSEQEELHSPSRLNGLVLSTLAALPVVTTRTVLICVLPPWCYPEVIICELPVSRSCIGWTRLHGGCLQSCFSLIIISSSPASKIC